MDSETFVPSRVKLSEKAIRCAENASRASVTAVTEIAGALRAAIDLFDKRRDAAQRLEDTREGVSNAVALQRAESLTEQAVQQVRDLCRIFLDAINAEEAAQTVRTGLAVFAA